MAYLDNNATTNMQPDTIKEMVLWCNKGNPSADYGSAKSTRAMIDTLRRKINQTTHTDFDVIFGSGASEANATAIHNVICMYNVPHILYSAIEHKSVIDCIRKYTELELCTSNVIPATRSGHVLAESIAPLLTDNTRLVCVMYANNEIGSINNISSIGKLCRANKCLFHTDTVQTFGKIPIIPPEVDSFCISFHKLGGPPGVGALCIRQGLFQVPLIYGTQNNSQRGGTENTPGLAASLMALNICHTKRELKNARMLKLKGYLCDELAKFGAISYRNYPLQANKKPSIMLNKTTNNANRVANNAIDRLTIVFLSGMEHEYFLCNTLLLSVVDPNHNICNAKLKAALLNDKIIISVGSACNTSSAKASHVLYSIGADEDIRKGALRISMSDDTTIEEIRYFITKFIEQLRLIV